MGWEEVAVVLVGALAGGIVNGLTGFGTGLTALGLWLYALPPSVASTLVIACSVIAQFQSLPMVWPTIPWRRVWPFVIPGVVGVPLGTWLLPHIEPRAFKIGIGVFLVLYSSYVLARRKQVTPVAGSKAVDGVVGFAGGVLGGLTGLSGIPPVVWTDFLGWTKQHRRGLIQAFNITVLSMSLALHAAAGLFTRQVALDTLVALPATIAGVLGGTFVYRRLADQGYQRAVMALLLVAGLGLIWTSR
jgi:uncharacterized membrane protein YfcA